MQTLIVTDVTNGSELDRITLDGDKITAGPLGQDLIDSLVRSLGITPAEAFKMRTGWSNGYIVAKLA